MKKLLSILCVCIALCFAFVGCGTAAGGNGGGENNGGNNSSEIEGGDNEGDEGNEGGDNEGDGEAEVKDKNIAGFDNLAKAIATINIMTDDGTDITGTSKPETQIYKDCTVGLANGRDGENLSAVTAKVRVRGNNTADYDKKSYRVKFDEKINLLGLNGGAKFKNWVLLACYKDVTFLRDAVVFELAKQTLEKNGYYASDYAFAEVNVNGAYNGLYMVAEQQQVNKNRVNINEPDENYTGNDIGWFIEFDGNARMTEDPRDYFMINYKQGGYRLTCEDGTLFYPGQTFDWGQAYYTIKNDIYAPSQNTFIKNYTENVFKLIYDAIYNRTYWAFNEDYTALVRSELSDAESVIAAAVDLDSMVDTFIIAEIACDNDVDWSSFFFTVDMSATGDKKLAFQAPWDFDSGFGMMSGLEEYDKIFSANVSTNAMKALNPWTAVFFSADWFRLAVAERFDELQKGGVFERLVDLIDKVTVTYAPYFAKNYDKWDNLGKIVDPVQGETVTTFATHADAATYLKNWLTHRVEFLSEYFSAISE